MSEGGEDGGHEGELEGFVGKGVCPSEGVTGAAGGPLVGEGGEGVLLVLGGVEGLGPGDSGGGVVKLSGFGGGAGEGGLAEGGGGDGGRPGEDLLGVGGEPLLGEDVEAVVEDRAGGDFFEEGGGASGIGFCEA